MVQNPIFSMTLRLLIVCFYSLIVLGSCNSAEEPIDTITFEDIEKEFQAIDISAGIQDVTIKIAENTYWNFRVIPPATLEAGGNPLILTFHGASGGSSEAHKGTDCYVEPGMEHLNGFIISPNADVFQWYDQFNINQVLTLTELAIDNWPVDASKVATNGYSNGGNATWLYVENRPDLFSAGIAMASSYDTSDEDGGGRKIDNPLWVIHGENDELFPVEITQQWAEQSIDAGSDITFIIADSLTHYKPCEYVPYLKEASIWLKDTVWAE
jgi:predicted peptidase